VWYRGIKSNDVECHEEVIEANLDLAKLHDELIAVAHVRCRPDNIREQEKRQEQCKRLSDLGMIACDASETQS
jgi:hypothetical protein